MHIAILASDGSPLSTVTGPLEALQAAHELTRQGTAGRTLPPLRCEVIASRSGPIQGSGGLQLAPHQTIATVGRPDLVLIAAIGNPRLRRTPFDPAVLDWLRHQHQRGATLASICTGAFLLAETGLLDHHLATTHWAFEADFRRRYPRVQLAIDQIITHECNLICSGGATAYLDLSLYLIEQKFGRAIADRCAQLLLADRRASQAVYASFGDHQQHDDSLIKASQRWLDQHYAEAVTAEAMADKVALSRRQFNRRFKQATGLTFLSYVQAVRMEKAKYLLKITPDPIEAIALRVGYEDITFFRRLFKREVGVSPMNYRRRF